MLRVRNLIIKFVCCIGRLTVKSVMADWRDGGNPSGFKLKRICPNTVNQTANVNQDQQLKESIFIRDRTKGIGVLD